MAKRLLFGLLAVLATGCEDEPTFNVLEPEVCLSRRDGFRYCIEIYEASRADATADSPGTDEASPPIAAQDRIPWVQITWAAAKTACESKGKRLCDFDEWVDACDGVVGDGGTVFAYGDMRDESNMTCNTGSGAAEGTGSRMACATDTGIFDQSGNVWEWTGNTAGAAAPRGGGFRSTQTHACDSVLMNVSNTDESPEVGFRCCRDF